MMKKNSTIKTYSELMSLPTFEERFDYLCLHGKVGEETFGFDRYLNQKFYRSDEWKQVRHHIIARDMGCDLGVFDYEIYGQIEIHHMNPITTEDIINNSDYLINPEYLICTSSNTHKAIHYGDKQYLNINQIASRTANDHCPWKK